MKSNAFFRILCFGLLGSLPAFAQTQTADQPTFRTEIHATSDRGPSFTLTNLSAKTLSAAQIRFSSSSKAVPSTEMGSDSARHQRPSISTPGASRTRCRHDHVSAPRCGQTASRRCGRYRGNLGRRRNVWSAGQSEIASSESHFSRSLLRASDRFSTTWAGAELDARPIFERTVIAELSGFRFYRQHLAGKQSP